MSTLFTFVVAALSIHRAASLPYSAYSASSSPYYQSHTSTGDYPTSTGYYYSTDYTFTDYYPTHTSDSYNPSYTSDSYYSGYTTSTYYPSYTTSTYYPSYTSDSYYSSYTTSPTYTSASYDPSYTSAYSANSTSASYYSSDTSTYSASSTSASYYSSDTSTYSASSTSASYEPSYTSSYSASSTSASYDPGYTSDSYYSSYTTSTYYPSYTTSTYYPSYTSASYDPSYTSTYSASSTSASYYSSDTSTYSASSTSASYNPGYTSTDSYTSASYTNPSYTSSAPPTCSTPSYGSGSHDTQTKLLTTALILENLELDFYTKFLATFTSEELLAANVSQEAQIRYAEIRSHEETHYKFLATALGFDPSQKVCTYTFDSLKTVRDFTLFGYIIEAVGIGAYTGALSQFNDPGVEAAAGNILTVENQHFSWMASAVTATSPWSGPLSSALDGRSVFTLISSLIDHCNIPLPFDAFPALDFNATTVSPGDSITLPQATQGNFAAFLTANLTTMVEIVDNQVTVPDNTSGSSFLYITSSEEFSLNTVLFGPKGFSASHFKNGNFTN